MKNRNEDIDQLSDKLISYLKDELKNSKIEYWSTLTQLLGGYQTLTYRFKLNGVEDELSKPLVLRLYPQFYGTNNVIWESTIQNVLFEEGLPVPKVYFVNTDESILGGAFFIMDLLPGRQLVTAPQKTIQELLGKTHAELHKIDPSLLVKKLNQKGIDETIYGLTSQFDWLNNNANDLSWIRECLDWFIENRPPEPAQLAICHRDFHGLNILFDDGRVTGIIDWGGLLITDPAFDVANTVMLITIPGRHLIGDNLKLDSNSLTEGYLSAYQTYRPLDVTNLSYYRAFRCLTVLIRGFVEVGSHYQSPPIVRDLLAYIQRITGIQITVPT